MTVEELHDVLAARLDLLEKNRDEKLDSIEKRKDESHYAIIKRLDAINGRIYSAEKDISNLRVRDAYWAGGAAAAILLIKLLWG